MQRETLVQHIQQGLPDVLAIYAFGSRVNGGSHSDSDLDLAVLVAGYAEPVQLWELAGNLAAIAGVDVDLLDLRAASTVMQYQVLTRAERWRARCRRPPDARCPPSVGAASAAGEIDGGLGAEIGPAPARAVPRRRSISCPGTNLRKLRHMERNGRSDVPWLPSPLYPAAGSASQGRDHGRPARHGAGRFVRNPRRRD